ncbi:MAG: hypothetical protein EA389_00545 [Ilumatobacter sp.]|nr:MAG: hypothetical protein EA389_00545 [Ilumatobacter sp.]
MDLDPVEYVLIEFPGNQFRGDIAPAIAELVERGLIHIIDVVFVSKAADGEVTWFEYDALDEGQAFAMIEGDADGLVNDDDIVEMAADLTPDSSALLIVWEDTWASALGRAVRDAGGRIVAGERIPHEVVEAAFAGIDD